MNIIIVSGRSGAGKSVALRALEDSGYYCVDNIPVNLLPELIKILQKNQQTIAISLDIRNLPQCPDSQSQLLSQLLETIEKHHQIHILFLDCERNVLIRRYSDSRRLHPLSQQDLSLEVAIDQEYAYIQPLKAHANLIIDTTHLSTHELADKLRLFALGKNDKTLKIIVQSFGFKYGVPLDADYIFDVRFLPNPYWIPELRSQTGLDEGVKNYLSQQEDVNFFIERTQEYLMDWLSKLEANNRSYLTIAIGCTGGKHRSVFVAERLGLFFQALGKDVQIQHKTLQKNAK